MNTFEPISQGTRGMLRWLQQAIPLERPTHLMRLFVYKGEIVATDGVQLRAIRSDFLDGFAGKSLEISHIGPECTWLAFMETEKEFPTTDLYKDILRGNSIAAFSVNARILSDILSGMEYAKFTIRDTGSIEIQGEVGSFPAFVMLMPYHQPDRVHWRPEIVKIEKGGWPG